MKYPYLTLIWFILNHTALAQSVSSFIGARSAALGNTTACHADEWSVFNNIGGLSKVKEPTAAFTYDARPALVAANRMAAVMVIPFQVGVAGIGLFRFGDNLYSEQAITAGYSNTFGITSIGIKANYIQYNAEGLGSKSVIGLSVGSLTKLTPTLSIGIHATNINQPRLSSLDNERLPVILCAGLGFTPTSKLFITAELEKNLIYKHTVKAGIEYQAHRKLYFRTGINIVPNAGFIGLAFKPKKFNLDYAYRFQTTLGSSHQATVSYKFKVK